MHFFASEQPIPQRTPAELVARMPQSAVRDMMEWGPAKTPVEQFALMTSHSVPLESLIDASPQTPPLQDDRPINEYFLLRKLFAGLTATLQ